MQLKRDEVKYVRDYAKNLYKRDTKCYICDSEEKLEFHHFYSITTLWRTWLSNVKGISVVNTLGQMIDLRDEFVKAHKKELYEEVVTLCSIHHDSLHRIYGHSPLPTSAEKQRTWCALQKDKYAQRV